MSHGRGEGKPLGDGQGPAAEPVASRRIIALPGGFGTLEEVLEITTWMQLGIHHKPIGLLNVEGYYRPLLELIRHGVEEGFIPSEQAAAIHHDEDPVSLVEKLLAATPVRGERTLTREET